MTEIDHKLIYDIIKNNVVKSTLSTLKAIGKCELTNKTYKEDTNEIMLYKLKGAEAVNSHHCYATIFYHKENEKYLKYANMYYECFDSLIQKHSLQNKTVNLYRSNGDIDKGYIDVESPIKFFEDTRGMCVYIKIKDSELSKWVPFNDTFSNSLNKVYPGLLSLNKELFDEELIIYFDSQSYPYDNDRDRFKKFFVSELDKLSINYKIV
jgi:hypothetical protein